MDSIFLGTVIGWYMLALGLLLLGRQEQMKLVIADILAKRGLFFTVAFVIFILGLLLVVSHNDWTRGWTLGITIFSWIILIGGLLRLFFMDEAIKMGKAWLNKSVHMNLFAVSCLVFGMYLLFHVYF